MNAVISLQVSRTMTGPVRRPTNEMPSKVILHQSIKINNFQSIIEKFWRQICIIDSIKESVVDFKETKDPAALVFNISRDGCVILSLL